MKNSTTSIHGFRWKFTPKLVPAVLALIFIPIFCSLGLWQYHRAQTKRELLAQFATRRQAQPLTLDALPKQNREYYPLTASGILDSEHQILVQNRYYQHKLGVEVLTPLRLDDHSLILVNRGWIPREKIQQLGKSTAQQVTLTGIIHTLPEKIFQIGEIGQQDSWPKSVQNSSWRELNRVLPGENIHPFILLLDKTSPYSFQPIYTPSIMPPEKHLGYAFQWFAMAVTCLVILVYSLTRRRPDEKATNRSKQ